jgi:hypothetical protein
MNDHDCSLLSVLLNGISALIALVVALADGWLARSGGMIPQKAIMCGGAAFETTMTLLVFILWSGGLLHGH